MLAANHENDLSQSEVDLGQQQLFDGPCSVYFLVAGATISPMASDEVVFSDAAVYERFMRNKAAFAEHFEQEIKYRLDQTTPADVYARRAIEYYERELKEDKHRLSTQLQYYHKLVIGFYSQWLENANRNPRF